MDRDDFRKMYQQEWPPPLELPADAPQPWLVIGDARAVRNVMQSDYYAPPRENLYWQTTSGPVANVTHREHIRGARGGTLFVLVPGSGFSEEHIRIIDEAYARGFTVRDLPTKRRETK